MCTHAHAHTRAYTTHTRVGARTHTHSRLHLNIFLFRCFQPLTLQGLRDTESGVHFKPDPHTFTRAPVSPAFDLWQIHVDLPAVQEACLCPFRTWQSEAPVPDRACYPAEHSAEAKLGHSRSNCICLAN